MSTDPLSALTRRYFSALPGAGRLEPGPGVAEGEAGSREEGTWVRFSLSPHAVRFQAHGCPHVLAVASWLAETLEASGAPPVDGPREWLARFEAPPEKLGRFLIVEDALRAALARKMDPWLST